MSNEVKFRRTDGQLTAYALACGYIQCPNDKRELYPHLTRELNVYYVRTGNDLYAVTPYPTLVEARKAYRASLKQLA